MTTRRRRCFSGACGRVQSAIIDREMPGYRLTMIPQRVHGGLQFFAPGQEKHIRVQAVAGHRAGGYGCMRGSR